MGLSEMIGSSFMGGGELKNKKNFGLISRNTDIEFLKKIKMEVE